jgi:hypothetical protein
MARIVEGGSMNTKDLVRHARELWNSPLVPTSVNRHNRKAWVRSVLRLGDKWLLAQPIRRAGQ